MAERRTSTPLPSSLRDQLAAVRSCIRRYLLLQALFLVVAWLLLVFWIGSAIDYLPVSVGSRETPTWFRIGLLTLMVVGPIWLMIFWLAPRWFTNIRDRSIALLIERNQAGWNNELVTAVELSEQSAEHELADEQTHEALLERVFTSVAKRAKEIQPTELFNWQPIWGAGVAACFGLAVTMLAIFLVPTWMQIWSNRLFRLSDQTWPRQAELRADGVIVQFPSFTGQLSASRRTMPFSEDGIAYAPSGSSVVLQISANAKDKTPPEACTLFFNGDDGSRGRANLRRIGVPQDGWQEFTLDGPPLDALSSSLNLDVAGLDARLRDLRLEVTDVAVVSELQIECSYPQYLLDTINSRPAKETVRYQSGIRIPEGTSISLVGKANKPLDSVEYYLQSRTSVADANQLGEGIDIQTATVSEDTFRIELGQLNEGEVIELRLTDNFGLPSDQVFRYVIGVLEDQPPEVESRLVGIGTSITPNALLPIRGTVTDDYEVATVQADLATSEAENKQVALDHDADELTSDIDLALLAEQGTLKLTPGLTLGLIVSATDYFDLEETQHIGQSLPKQLAVVSPDQLLTILDRRELELRERMDQIIIELEELREILKLLESMVSNSNVTVFGKAPSRLPFTTVFQDEEAGDLEQKEKQLRRSLILRSQQSLLQSEKSEQELASIANRIENIRLQLVNNRIDSIDRQERLQKKIYEPLKQLLEREYKRMDRSLKRLQTSALSDKGSEDVLAAQLELARVIELLKAIHANMLDIESFNEIVDLFRGLLEDQEKLLEETESEQKARILDFLK